MPQIQVTFAYDLQVDEQMLQPNQSDEWTRHLDRCLLHEFLNNHQSLLSYVIERISEELINTSPEELAERLGYPLQSARALFLPSILRLPGEVGHVWRGIANGEHLEWCLESIQNCLRITPQRGFIKELKSASQAEPVPRCIVIPYRWGFGVLDRATKSIVGGIYRDELAAQERAAYFSQDLPEIKEMLGILQKWSSNV